MFTPQQKLVASVFTVTATLCSSVYADDLLALYEDALESDPVIREARAHWQAAYESKPQALSYLLPEINLTGQYEEDNFDGSSVFPTGVDDGMGGISTALVATDQSSNGDLFSWQIELTQPLLRWDRIAALSGASKVIAKADIDYQVAEQELILRVAERYFDALAADDQVNSAVDNERAFTRQLEQATKRFDVGLVTITDVHEAQAAADSAIAEAIAAKQAASTAHERLREIVGHRHNELSRVRDDMPLVSPEPDDVEQWLNQALAGNLSLLAAQLDADIAATTVKVESADRLPTLEFFATYDEFDRNATQFNDGIKGPADSDRDTETYGLLFRLPIFTGGRNTSEIREAKFLHNAAKERLIAAVRRTERDTRDAFLTVQSDLSRVNALEQAMISAGSALQATKKGMEVGTRTMVDVLLARRVWSDAQTTYLRSRYDYLLASLRLRFATGSLSTEDLQNINAWLSD